jgi:hypothetical protein
MRRPLGADVELPRKGGWMTAGFDPEVGAFMLAEQMRS